MKLAVLALAGSLQFGASPERAQSASDDRWFARDKALHFGISALIQSIAHNALRASGADYREASVAAGVLTLSVGVTKELWDRADGRYFSWKDLTADAFGAGSAAVIVRQVDR